MDEIKQTEPEIEKAEEQKKDVPNEKDVVSEIKNISTMFLEQGRAMMDEMKSLANKIRPENPDDENEKDLESKIFGK